MEALDTPALIVDLACLDANAAAIDVTLAGRIEAWVHKTPDIARLQVSWPGVAGIAVRSIAEAEVFAAHGFDDIRILRPLVTAASRRRAADLGHRVRLVFEPDRALCGTRSLDGAVTVSARVVGVPETGRAILDAGQKAVGRDFGDPLLLGRERSSASAGSAEHGIVTFPPDEPLGIGDWVQLVPADIATVFSLHDVAYGVRDGRLSAVWPVAARGAF